MIFASAVAAANSNVAVGAITGGDRSYILDASGNLEKPEDFAKIIVATRNGLPVRLGDLAKVISSYEQLRGGAKFNGEPSLTVAITRQPGANVVKLVDDVRAVLPTIRESLPPSVSDHAGGRSVGIGARIRSPMRNTRWSAPRFWSSWSSIWCSAMARHHHSGRRAAAGRDRHLCRHVFLRLQPRQPVVAGADAGDGLRRR